MNHNAFIKLKDFFKILDISAEIAGYEEVEDRVEGTLCIKGKYLHRDNVSDDFFLENIPFSILINNENIEVEDVNCIDFEYLAIDGRGIDVTFDILVKYDLYEEVPVVTTSRDEMVLKKDDINDVEVETEENDFEKIKEVETKRIDQLLKSTLNYKDDNLPTNEIVIRGLKEEKSQLKVYYYQTEAELAKVCDQHNLAINKVFSNNQKYDFNKYHRVIVNDK